MNKQIFFLNSHFKYEKNAVNINIFLKYFKNFSFARFL